MDDIVLDFCHDEFKMYATYSVCEIAQIVSQKYHIAFA